MRETHKMFDEPETEDEVLDDQDGMIPVIDNLIDIIAKYEKNISKNTIARSTIGGSTLLYDSSRDLTIVLTSNCLAAHPNAAREIVDLVCDLLDLGAPLDLFA